jgi:hypothetical protein
VLKIPGLIDLDKTIEEHIKKKFGANAVAIITILQKATIQGVTDRRQLETDIN